VQSEEAGQMALKIVSEGVESDIVNLEAIEYAKLVASIDDADAIMVG